MRHTLKDEKFRDMISDEEKIRIDILLEQT